MGRPEGSRQAGLAAAGVEGLTNLGEGDAIEMLVSLCGVVSAARGELLQEADVAHRAEFLEENGVAALADLIECHLRRRHFLRLVVQGRDEEDAVGAFLAEFAFDAGHPGGVIGGADAGTGGGDDDVEPVVLQLFATDLKIDPFAGGIGEAPAYAVKDGGNLLLGGHSGPRLERLEDGLHD
jgi:hypothetical protein